MTTDSVYIARSIRSTMRTRTPFLKMNRVEEFHCLLTKGYSMSFPHQRANGYRIFTTRSVDEIKAFATPLVSAKSRFSLYTSWWSKPWPHCTCAYVLILIIQNRPFCQYPTALKEVRLTRHYPIIRTIAKKDPNSHLRTCSSFPWTLWDVSVDAYLPSVRTFGPVVVHWLFTYHGHHKQRIYLPLSAFDFFLLYSHPYVAKLADCQADLLFPHELSEHFTDYVDPPSHHEASKGIFSMQVHAGPWYTNWWKSGLLSSKENGRCSLHIQTKFKHFPKVQRHPRVYIQQ